MGDPPKCRRGFGKDATVLGYGRGRVPNGNRFAVLLEALLDAEMEQVLSRRLAAVLCADIAGYSALVSADESGAIAALKGHQTAVIAVLTRHGGRVVDLAGDGLVAEFPSTVSAVEAGLAMQTVMGSATRRCRKASACCSASASTRAT